MGPSVMFPYFTSSIKRPLPFSSLFYSYSLGFSVIQLSDLSIFTLHSIFLLISVSA